MRILAFDTCLEACSAALIEAQDGDVRVITRRHEPMVRGHAERLVPMIEEVMDEAGLAYGALDAIAVTRGPGTFTGVRIGVATARALALAAGKPILATTSLALLAATARACREASAQALPIVAATDARKGEIYVALPCAEGSASGHAAAAMTPDAAARGLAALAPAQRWTAVGSGAPALTAAAAALGIDIAAGPASLQPDAAAMADAHPVPSQPLIPLYLRAADAVPPAPSDIARLP